MARPDKATAVAELTEGFRSSSAVLLTEYRGLTVAQLKELRRSLGENVTYAVVKNTLTKIAARQAAVSGLEDLLAGPSAIAFVSGDPVEAAKGLRDFAKAHPLLVIKGGVMDGRSLSPDEIRKLADLESREVLLAKLAGAMKASLSGAVSLFAAPLSQTARLIEALRQKAEQDPSILRGGAGTPVAAAPAEHSHEPDAVAAAEPQIVAESTAAGGTESASTEPGSTESDSIESDSTEPGSTEPGSTEPGSTESASTESGSTESGSTESASTESGSTESDSTESDSTEPGSTEPARTESDSTAPVSTAPVSTEPQENTEG